MVLKIEKNCPTAITTKSGTFTFYEQNLLSCQAEQFCQNKGHILAPITNREDRRAIEKIGGQNCGIFRESVQGYHVGLEIKACGNKLTKVFSNGVKYDETLHDKLYDFYPTKEFDCFTALYPPGFGADEKIVIVAKYNNCKGVARRFICLDPAKPDNNSTVTEEAHHLKRSKRSENFIEDGILSGRQSAYFMSEVFAFCFLVTACCFLFVANRKLKKRVNLLEIKNKSFTSECKH